MVRLLVTVIALFVMPLSVFTIKTPLFMVPYAVAVLIGSVSFCSYMYDCIRKSREEYSLFP